MKKVKFLKTYTVKAQGGETFEGGQVYELGDASAAHHVNKGRAVEVDKPERGGPQPLRGHPAAAPAGGDEPGGGGEGQPKGDQPKGPAPARGPQPGQPQPGHGQPQRKP